jgi:ribosome-associated toxin RatA of RatAB toxin-antitoxin module
VRSTISIDIEAPPALVFALARDVARWPDLLPHYLRVRIRDRHPDGAVTAEMVAVRTLVPALGFAIPVAWRSRTWSEPESRQLRFVHQGGATDGMDVIWRIEPTSSGCRVEIEHEFAPRSAIWATLVNGLFVRPIATRTLATFKAIAEAVVASGVSAPKRSGTRPSTKSQA